MVPRRSKLQGIKRERGADLDGSNAAAAPATVGGEPVAILDHWETGKVGNRRRPASQETCHRKRDRVALASPASRQRDARGIDHAAFPMLDPERRCRSSAAAHRWALRADLGGK